MHISRYLSIHRILIIFTLFFSLAAMLIAGFACNGRGIAMSTAMGRELADWAFGREITALAIPVRPATRIPFHRFARLAPNAMLPISLVRDRIDATSRSDERAGTD